MSFISKRIIRADYRQSLHRTLKSISTPFSAGLIIHNYPGSLMPFRYLAVQWDFKHLAGSHDFIQIKGANCIKTTDWK